MLVLEVLLITIVQLGVDADNDNGDNGVDGDNVRLKILTNFLWWKAERSDLEVMITAILKQTNTIISQSVK